MKLLKWNAQMKFFVFLLSGYVLSVFTSACPPPENNTSHWFALPAFLIFLLFVFSILGWGSILRKKLSLSSQEPVENALIDLTLGTLFIYLAAYTLTALGLFSSSLSIISWVLVTSGIVWSNKKEGYFSFFIDKEKKIDRLIYALPLIVVGLRLIEGFQFPQHGDAYYVYLPAPRLWATHGGFGDYLRFTDFFFSTSWESLFAMGTVLMGLKEGHGLDLSQYFSQWVTAGVGVLGIVFSLTAIAKRLIQNFPLHERWIPIMVVFALQIPCLRWTANLAKNDMGVIFWGCSAFFFSIFIASKSRSGSLITGILMGALVIGKLNTAVLGVMFSITLLISNRKYFHLYVFGGLIGISPVIIRNLIITHNPIFPWKSGLFGTLHLLSAGSASVTEGFTEYKFEFEQFMIYLKDLLLEAPLIVSFLIIPFMKPYGKKFLNYCTAPIIALGIYLVFFRFNTETRLMGPALLLCGFLGAYFSFFLLDHFFKNKKMIFSSILTIGILVNSNISFYTLTQLKSEKFHVWSRQTHKQNEIGSPSKLWIRENLSNKESILIGGDGYIYYLVDYPITNYTTLREYEKAIADKNITLALELFKNAPYRYLYLAGDIEFMLYRKTLLEMMEKTSAWNQSCKIYHSGNTMIWDLMCLQKELPQHTQWIVPSRSSTLHSKNDQLASKTE